MKRGATSLRERLGLVSLNPGRGRFLLSVGLGAASVLGFAPFYLYLVPVATLAGLAWLWQRTQSVGQPVSLGFGFGLGYFFVGASWVYVSMHDFGGMAWPVAGVATMVFCSIFSFFPAVAGWLYTRVRAAGCANLIIVFPAAWTSAEWMRGWVFTGFPWLTVGYSQAPSGPLSGFAPIVGVYGVSMLAAASAGLLVWIADVLFSTRGKSPVRRASALLWHPALLLLAAFWFGGWCLQRIPWTAPAGAPVTVTLIQGNIEQEMKWRPEWARSTLETYLALTLASRSRLILLPETAVPLFNLDVPPGYLDALARHARDNGGDLLLGIPEYVPGNPPRYYNSVISLGTHSSQTYRKYHLVPFGDYFPHWVVLAWIMNTIQVPMSDFSRGDPFQRPLAVAGEQVAANICYEDAFGEEIIRQLPKATLLANFTNDAWWGKSIASEQHLQMAQMRSQETGRSMLRVTNTGVTAIIDEHGRITNRLPQFVTAALEGLAQGRTGSTPYVRWGNWPLLALVAAALILPSLWAWRLRVVPASRS